MRLFALAYNLGNFGSFGAGGGGSAQHHSAITYNAPFRFFILTTEYDLSNPDNLLCLDMFAVSRTDPAYRSSSTVPGSWLR